ncbi:glutamyl-tRNA reductase [Poriferisphaera sp. WC338]|uniref:glutamyl-tRNA reductase n=1 Tax=Poriferisphaera sp. WC338 TaxID=3425129 RepID=UPI003D8145AA
MRILMLGINHRTAPIDIREQLAVASTSLEADLIALKTAFPTTEFVLLSTCNRTEIYAARPTHDPPTIEQLRDHVAARKNIHTDKLTAASIHREQQPAITHLLHVAAGLDSMILGETEILGQIKRAYEFATEQQAVGPVLHKLFQQAIAAAKQIRTRTGIDTGRVSVGSIAADLAQQIFSDFTDKTILTIGAGEIAKVTLAHLKSLSPKKLYIVNRSQQRATELAESLSIPTGQGTVQNFDQLPELLVTADIVISSTASPHPILRVDDFKAINKRRRNRPLFIIDLAVPRDIDPAIASLSNIYLYNIDDLQTVITSSLDQRSDKLQTCQAYLAEVAATCMNQINNRDLGRLIKKLRTRLNDIGELEKERSLTKLNNLYPHADQSPAEKLLEEHTHRLINKILHLPLSQLDHGNPDAPLGFYASALRRLFDLDDADLSPSVSPTSSPNNADNQDATPSPPPQTPPKTNRAS